MIVRCGVPRPREVVRHRPLVAGAESVVKAKLPLKEISRLAKETAVRVALEKASGNLQRAAMTLGVTDRALQMRRAQKPAS